MEPQWVQAFAAIMQLAAAIVLIYVTYRYVVLTDRMVQAQVEPQITLELNLGLDELVIGNDGIYPVVDLFANADTVVFVGPPKNLPVATLKSGRRIPGKPRHDWWQIKALAPSEVQTKSVSDIAENALNMVKMLEKSHAEGGLKNLPPSEKVQLYAVIAFRLNFHRQVDLKRYSQVKKVFVHVDSQTGKALVFDADIGPSFFQEIAKSIL